MQRPSQILHKPQRIMCKIDFSIQNFICKLILVNLN